MQVSAIGDISLQKASVATYRYLNPTCSLRFQFDQSYTEIFSGHVHFFLKVVDELRVLDQLRAVSVIALKPRYGTSRTWKSRNVVETEEQN